MTRLPGFYRPAQALAAAALLALGIAGCMVGPNYHPPSTDLPASWGEAGHLRATTQPAQIASWWKSFNDPTLDRLIQEAIKGNIGLRQAQERIQQARAERNIAAAALWPTVAARATYQRFRSSNAFATSGPSGGRTAAGAAGIGGIAAGGAAGTPQNLFQAGLDAVWELDIFGRIRRQIQAADANTAAAIEDRRDILVTLLAEVAINYIELRGFQRQIEIAQSNLQAQRQTLELTRERFEAGADTGLDVAQAEAQVANTASQIPPLESSLRQTMHQLGILLGRQPMALAELAATARPIPAAAPEIPIGMPSALIRQRPDIRRAERQLAAATALTGVAVANLFPQFALTGSVGQTSLRLEDLANSASRTWSFGPSVNWTVFDGGALIFNVRAANAAQQQALWTYQQTVLTALGEVENALVAYGKELAHHRELIDAVAANQRNVDLSMSLYIHGRTDFLNVLTAQQSLYAVQESLALSDRALSTDMVAVYKALGGGWEEQSK